jgi:hypothetical protein
LNVDIARIHSSKPVILIRGALRADILKIQDNFSTLEKFHEE